MEFHRYLLIPILYLAAMNLAGFLLMHEDKKRAIRKEWRIREAVLFGVAALGGALGSILGMYTFRHKTKHWYFVIGMPAILILHLCLGVFLYLKFGFL